MTAMKIQIAFRASRRPEAQEALQRLTKRYGQCSEDEAEIIVALGGDGSMLEAMRRRFSDRKPVYGMNRGTVGFLMNDFEEDNLYERINKASKATLVPLRMIATDVHGERYERLAINEVSLFRETAQSAKLSIRVDGRERMSELTCDGIMVATPAGSTAYNLSAHGPILPIGANLLALTPVSAFRPRRWRGALLRHDAKVEFDIVEPNRRPVAASADNQEVRDIAHVSVLEDRSKPLTMLFDPGHALDERILREQFAF
nr:NAD kinase [Henriciella mobilis]